ncbi:hypothetical protein D9758_007992 [Tetrapyrgos nigripes]|uniref:Uncharacterized protein n=1 Tax=Tetrapyrgos nigripes TaxID=182062 RepID=A0A8H5D0D0_9AGAR|nr:hypothetical protein D9758_007992 [Tetrapyrgos nigripes]
MNNDDLDDLYDKVWSGYDLPKSPSRSRSARPLPLPPTPSMSNSPVSTLPPSDYNFNPSRQQSIESFPSSTTTRQLPTPKSNGYGSPVYPDSPVSYTPVRPPITDYPPPPLPTHTAEWIASQRKSYQPVASGSSHGVNGDSIYTHPGPPQDYTYENLQPPDDIVVGGGGEDQPYDEDDYFWEDEEEDESRFVNFSLLSHIAVQLKDKVPRGTHVKGSIPYPRAFTGRDIVSTIQSLIQRELAINHDVSTSDRRAAIQVARSLQSQLFFYEVEWGGRVLQDGLEDVYMFLDDPQDGPSGSGGGGGGNERAELPTGVVTALTKCYSPDCVEGSACYSPRCPRRGDSIIGPIQGTDPSSQSQSQFPYQSTSRSTREEWIKTVPRQVLGSLPESEINRQTIIHKLIAKEEQYLADLDCIETVFIRPLRAAALNPPSSFSNESSNPNGLNGPSLNPTSSTPNGPPLLPELDDFIDIVFSNILDLRECNRRLLESLYVRQREQFPVIQRIGDLFLEAASEFRLAYPAYIGGLQQAEKRLREEMEGNYEFRTWVEHCSRQLSAQSTSPDSSSSSSPRLLDLKHYLTLPSSHLSKYPILLEAILHSTDQAKDNTPDAGPSQASSSTSPHHQAEFGNPDASYLTSAIEAISNLQSQAQLQTFQNAMGAGVPGKWEWHDLVGKEARVMLGLDKKEVKRQAIIFELIKGEMSYVKDLENIEVMYIRPLRSADPPIIPPDRLDSFIHDVFHNFAELHAHHRRLIDRLHEIQREEHPIIRSITAAVFDSALFFRDAYIEYIPNYPIAAYRIDDEMASNPAFKGFVENAVRHPDAHRLDMKNFINRPIPRLLRYELLLKNILDETPPDHEDRDDIPQVLEVIKALGKDSEPGVVSAKQKVELWRYNSNIVFKPGEWIDMDLLDKNRSLIHFGRLLRQPDSGLEWNGWSELFVLLFDNYFVMTKAREKDGYTKYYVNRRVSTNYKYTSKYDPYYQPQPIPLDLLTLVNFTDPPTQRGAGLLRNLRGGERHNTAPSDPTSLTLGSSNSYNTKSPDLPTHSSSSIPTTTSTPTDSRSVYPCTIHHNGRMGGPYILYAESAQVRAEWKSKLEEALGLRKAVQDNNKVFEVETLSNDTFLVPSLMNGSGAGAGGDGSGSGGSTQAWNQNHDNTFTGKVTCTVPLNTPDGRGLVAIGCAEGVWIGFRHDSRSMRRVLHLKMVTQCAMLEDFGIFLVLADKMLFAYHIEALVPSSPSSTHATQTPQKLSGNKDVHFFSVGTLLGRTLVIYMKKKGLDSIFHVVEPVLDKINERSKTPASLGSRFGFRSPKSEWFRNYREFFLPSESYDLIFLKAKIAILCAKGFEVMDLTDLQSATIPQREDARHAPLAKRWESVKPLGMFRSTDEEFLLCYTEFGLYVNKHGDPSRPTGSIEWEGTAERVALHNPYILLFDTRFIEVRHIQTGRLAQIIPGNDVHCLWDGRGVNISANHPFPGGPDEQMVQEARVHGVMTAPNSVLKNGTGARSIKGAVAQHVFELIPTIPLYLPGSLASPSTATYFPQSFSPPHSPTMRPSLRPTASYRF